MSTGWLRRSPKACGRGPGSGAPPCSRDSPGGSDREDGYDGVSDDAPGDSGLHGEGVRRGGCGDHRDADPVRQHVRTDAPVSGCDRGIVDGQFSRRRTSSPGHAGRGSMWRWSLSVSPRPAMTGCRSCSRPEGGCLPPPRSLRIQRIVYIGSYCQETASHLHHGALVEAFSEWFLMGVVGFPGGFV
jgi:hypothetical protein